MFLPKAQEADLIKTKGGFESEQQFGKHFVLSCKSTKARFAGILSMDV